MTCERAQPTCQEGSAPTWVRTPCPGLLADPCQAEADKGNTPPWDYVGLEMSKGRVVGPEWFADLAESCPLTCEMYVPFVTRIGFAAHLMWLSGDSLPLALGGLTEEKAVWVRHRDWGYHLSQLSTYNKCEVPAKWELFYVSLRTFNAVLDGTDLLAPPQVRMVYITDPEMCLGPRVCVVARCRLYVPMSVSCELWERQDWSSEWSRHMDTTLCVCSTGDESWAHPTSRPEKNLRLALSKCADLMAFDGA